MFFFKTKWLIFIIKLMRIYFSQEHNFLRFSRKCILFLVFDSRKQFFDRFFVRSVLIIYDLSRKNTVIVIRMILLLKSTIILMSMFLC